jgi:hypothetical protein
MSVYREPASMSTHSAGDFRPEEVKIINALRLKRLMDGDLSDDDSLF